MRRVPDLEALVARRSNPEAAAARMRRVEAVVSTLRTNGVPVDGYRLASPFRRGLAVKSQNGIFKQTKDA